MSATNRGSKRRPQDFYETPEWVTRALLGSVELCEPILEPAAGRGAIQGVLREFGLMSKGIEIDPQTASENRYCEPVVRSYFDQPLGGAWLRTIITNPPYSLALKFIEKALADVHPEGGQVFMLLRLSILGPKKYRHLWTPGSGFRCCYVLPKRPSFTGDGKTDAAAYAWFQWVAGYDGVPQISHLEMPLEKLQ